MMAWAGVLDPRVVTEGPQRGHCKVDGDWTG
jgi:hypothetical protein